jgi:putative sterol carrier protein
VTKGVAPARADLRITMKPENFHKLVAKMTPPPLLMLTGQMKIKGFGAMGTFAKLFPEPKPDAQLSPSAL